MQVKKGLVANGTDSAKIRFLAADAAKPFGTVKVEEVSSVQYVEFKGGGVDAKAMFDLNMFGTSDTVTASHLVFDDGHGTACFRLAGPAYGTVNVEDLTFTGCSGTTYTLGVDPEMLKYLTAENDYGTSPKFLIPGFTVYEALTFKDMGVLYIIKGGATPSSTTSSATSFGTENLTLPILDASTRYPSPARERGIYL